MLKDWSDVYSIGIPEIDEQHKGFFAASHRLYDAIMDFTGKDAVAEAIAFMRDYAGTHFRTEEAFMRRHDYLGLDEHIKLHVAFMATLRNLEDDLSNFGPDERLADRALDITQDWLINHIADEDVLYALHVKSRIDDELPKLKY
jgi:hemerythrin